jgi:sulfatase modifying factor 1
MTAQSGVLSIAAPEREAPVRSSAAGMMWLDAGSFLMGSNRHYREERPVRRVAVDSFWIDRFLVTNSEFARFVDDTGYVTQAETQPNPGSMVFVQPRLRPKLKGMSSSPWWRFVHNAMWRRPHGPGSSLAGREDHPVVHVTFDDATAYAAWAGKMLPTEAEWERAARGGLESAAYAWGDQRHPAGKEMANTWQGEFPWENLATDGFVGTSPVGRFPANGYGLYDMIGNVWEWTTDWYSVQSAASRSKACCASGNPIGASVEASQELNGGVITALTKVIKGGSHLCAPNHCRRYRPAARYPQPVATSACHLGFRCVMRPAR